VGRCLALAAVVVVVRSIRPTPRLTAALVAPLRFTLTVGRPRAALRAQRARAKPAAMEAMGRLTTVARAGAVAQATAPQPRALAALAACAAAVVAAVAPLALPRQAVMAERGAAGASM
jgi:hypothetical protein